MNRIPLLAFLALAFPCLALQPLAAEDRLDFLSSGAASLLHSYMPIDLSLEADPPASLSKAPVLAAPRYSIIPIKSEGGRVFHLVLDIPASGPVKAYVDRNGNGDLTDDPAVELRQGKDQDGFAQARGTATVSVLAGGRSYEASVVIDYSGRAEPKAASSAGRLSAYRDYAFSGKVLIGGKKCNVVLSDDGLTGDFSNYPSSFFIDLDGNGDFSFAKERFNAGDAFAAGGKTYELSAGAMDGHVRVSEYQPPKPGDAGFGKPSAGFAASDIEGKSLAFPGDFKGRIILLDFWATWCGPCMAEGPGLVEARRKFGPKGFEILGISLDAEGDLAKLRSVTKEKGMAWRQVFGSSGGSQRVSQAYSIRSIPSPFLIDGDSGEILASGASLRGARLAPTIEANLRRKGLMK
jgi:thiol-disulfide isomerase/thioredoxin